MSPLCASEAQDLLLLKHRLPSSLAAAPDQLCPSCASGLCWLVCSNQTTFLKRRHCRFWLSFSFYLSPPLFFCFYRVLEGTYLASVRICPFQCEKADDDDSRKVGWWAWTRTRARTFFHTHTYSSFSFSYAENRIVEALKGQKHVAVSSLGGVKSACKDPSFAQSLVIFAN